MDYKTMAEVRDANERAGYHFFSEGAMRFFGSKVLNTLYTGPGGEFFVTSEQRKSAWGGDPGGPRRYTVRQPMPDGSIDTVGEFMQYATAADAKKAARRAAAGKEE